MNFYAVSSLINFLTSIIVCLAMLSKDKRNKLDWLFIGFAFSVAFWSFGYFFWQLAGNATEALLWSKVFMAGAIAIAVFYLNFIWELLGLSQQDKKFLIFSDLLFSAFLVFDFTPWFITGVKPAMQFAFWPQPGIAFDVFLIAWFAYVIYASYVLYRGFKKESGLFKLQIKNVLVGMIIGFSGGATNYLLWYHIQVPPFGNILVSVYVTFVFYSIVRYKMFNIRIIATELFVLGLLTVSIFEFFQGNSQNIYLQSVIIVLIVVSGILLVRSVLNEVRERDQLAELSKQLETANQQLKLLDQAKSEFLSVASHQLRTPLTAIKGYVSMFLEGDFGQVSEEQRKNLQIVFDSAQRLAVLVSDLLDLSRIESGRMEFDFVAVNLCEVVESVISEITPKAKAKKLYLFFDNVNRSCPEIRADLEKIRQVVINLIDNAIKYTVTGGVTVTLHRVGEQLQLSVADTGIGVDPAEKDRLFEKFFRTTAANELTREGTGLGIYVVKKIVEAHGGSITFNSKGSGKGTTFIISLPIPKTIKPERVLISALEGL